MKDFQNRVVVITGAGSGIGRALARAFASHGARLALNDYRGEALAGVSSELGKSVGIHQAFDVGRKSEVYAFAERVQEELGGASVVINNAGISGAAAPVEEIRDRDFERVMQVNFWGVVYGTRAFLPQLLSQPEGALVNVSSVFGLLGMPFNGDYCASKFAVRGFTESLMSELYETNVSVHSLHPGGIATDILRNRPEMLEIEEDGLSEAFSDKFLRTDPAEVAAAVIAAIRKGQLRIVIGSDSGRVAFASRFFPLSFLTKMTWKEISGLRDKMMPGKF